MVPLLVGLVIYAWRFVLEPLRNVSKRSISSKNERRKVFEKETFAKKCWPTDWGTIVVGRLNFEFRHVFSRGNWVFCQ